MPEPDRKELDELALFYEGTATPEIEMWTITIPFAHCREEIGIDESGYATSQYFLNEESEEWASMSLHSDYWVYGPEYLFPDAHDWNPTTGRNEPRCSFIVTSYQDFIAAKLLWG